MTTPPQFPTDRPPDRRRACELLCACNDNCEAIQRWNAYRKNNVNWRPELSDDAYRADLCELILWYADEDCRIQGIDLSKALLHLANLSKVDLRLAGLSHADLSGADLSKAILRGAKLEHANLEGAILEGASLSGAILEHAKLASATLDHAYLDAARLGSADLRGATLRSAKLGRAVLDNALLSDACFSGAHLNEASLRGCDLSNADLTGADLRDCEVDGRTNLRTSKTKRCRIDRHTLDSLDPQNQPSVADRRRMIIEDPVAMLRAAYGGFWQWIHLLAFLVFLAPYAWFLVSHWTVARFTLDPGEDSLPLWECLLRYIYSGGTAWKDGWHLNLWPFAAFLLSMAYNALRLIMLWRTKTLELGQQVTGLPALYPLSGHRLWLYRFAKYGLWINLLVVAYHSFHFLTQRVPLG